MSGERILIVEDDAAVAEMLAFALERAGMRPRCAADAREAEAALAEEGLPDLVLMDWMLPGTSGIALTRRWKEAPATRELPVIMVTARGEEADKVRALETGADDYVTKPFSPRELAARIRAVLRRAGRGAAPAGPLRVDPARRRAETAAGAPIRLGRREFDLLAFLVSRPERVYTRDQLLDAVWGGVPVEQRTVDVHVRRLRRALEPHGLAACIRTVRGVGYAYDPQAAGAGGGG